MKALSLITCFKIWLSRPSLVALVGMLAFVAGCKHSPGGFYPIGIYGVRSTNDFSVLRESGFNVVCGSAAPGYLNAAQAAGLKVLAGPGTSAGKGFDPAVARRTVTAFDAHPALWAWYVIDEPDLNLVPPELVIEAQRFLRQLPARKPTALVIQNGAEAIHYANIADITMIDRYPIPWQPLASFDQHVRLTRLALGKKKPLIAVLQAMDWSYYPEFLPGEKNLRPPSYEELRCMTYSALVQRANGLFYYAYDDGRWRMSEHPQTWGALQKVVNEVNQRLPLFQAEHLWWPWRHVIKYKSTERMSEVLESSVVLTLLRVERGNQSVSPGHYILAVNTTVRNHTLRIYLPILTSNPVPALGEDRSLLPEANWIEDEFPPMAVRIYGPLPDANLPRQRQSSNP